MVKVQNAYDGPIPWARRALRPRPDESLLLRAVVAVRPERARSRTVPAPSVPAPCPARPAVYYRWTDDRGVLHASHQPPPEGIVYSTIRAIP